MVWRRAWSLGTTALTTMGLMSAVGLVPQTAAAERVVFINTEPVVLTTANGQDPATNSYNATGFVAGPISGWPELTPEDQNLFLYWLKEGSVEFDVVYTFVRPMSGDYDMIVMGSAADNASLFPGIGCSAAIGLADCNDANGPNISFLFPGCMSDADQANLHKVAFRTFAALGFGWGLENLSATGQIMGGYTSGGLHFGDTCAAIAGTQNCIGQHVGCADGTQNSTADLNARLGPRVDDGPPTVFITSPEDNAVVEPDIMVQATVGDLFGGLEVQLEIVEAGMALVDETPPYGWSLAGIPQGTWTLRVTATDADLNVTTEEISICVDVPECGLPPASDSTGGDSTTGDDTTSGGDSTTSGGSTSTGEPPPPPPEVTTGPPPDLTGFGGGTPDTGCGCRSGTDGGGGLPWMLGLLLGLGALRRRE